MTEKIMRFHILRNEKIILPDYTEYLTDIYPYYFLMKRRNKFPVDDYNYRIYKDEQLHEYILVNEEAAYNDFFEKGGVFSNYELKNIKFQRLFDRKFVLNEK